MKYCDGNPTFDAGRSMFGVHGIKSRILIFMVPMRIVCFVVPLIVTFLLAACGPGDTPEDEVRLFVKAGEKAAEARDIGALKELVSERYGDDHQRTRRDIIAIAARYFLTNKNIHVFSRIDNLLFPEADKAELVLYVAMTGRNVSDLDALLNMQADLYRFDMKLVRENKEWQLVSAEWRSAEADDFF